MEPKIEVKENLKFVNFGDVLRKLGQTQYSSRFVDPNPIVHEDGTPHFSEIRIKGDPDDYYSLEICEADVRKFIELWFDYKKTSSPFFENKKLEDFL